MITEFVLVRHGETASNADGIIQGHLQTELNEKGLYQARLAGKALADERFDLIVSSDLFRALKTAQTIAEENIHKGIPIQTTPELREWDLTTPSGFSPSAAARFFPLTARYNKI